MAIIKFNNRRNSKCSKRINKLNRGIRYITDHKKTVSYLIGGTGVDENTAYERMKTVKQFYGKEGGREYIHFCVSFKGKRDEELVSFIAENISVIFADFQVLFAVHTNTPNTHIHFIINSVNVNNGRKFSQSRTDLQRLKDIINEISNKFGLEIDEMTVDEDDDYLFEYEDYYEENLIEPMIFMDPEPEKQALIEAMIFYDELLP